MGNGYDGKVIHTLQVGMIGKDLLPGVSAMHPPGAELTTGILRKHLIGLCLKGLGLGSGLELGLVTRLTKGAPRLHHPLAILVHDIPEEGNPETRDR